MEYFRREIINSIVIEKINLSNVTFIETKVFWERLQKDFYAGYVYFILDLTNCLTIDSTLIDMINNINSLLCKKNGVVRLVLNSDWLNEQNKISGLSECIGIDNSVETAINQFTLSGAEQQAASL